jgi:hypothetical protein
MPLGTAPPFLQEGIQKVPLAGATGGRLRASVYSSGAGAPVKEFAWCMVRHAQAASKAFYGSKTHDTITLCPSVGTYVDRVRSAEVLCGPRFSECFSFPITSDRLPTLVTCLPCCPQFYSHLLDNARILLANLLQRSRSTFSWGSFLSFFAFKEGILDTQISALGG